MEISVLQVSEGLSADLGGTAVVVSQLSNLLALHGITVSLFGLSEATGKPLAISLDSRVLARDYKPALWYRLGFSREMARALKGLPPPDLVHIHGLWRLHYAQAYWYTRKHQRPFVLSTHGMLEPWALDRSKRAKQIARRLYQDKILKTADCLHTTAQEEADTLRELGFHGPIAVIPWGVEIPAGRDETQRLDSATTIDVGKTI